MNNTNFASKISKHQSYYSPEVWSKVERELDKRRKRRILLFFLLGLSIMMTIGLSSYHMSKYNKPTDQNALQFKNQSNDPILNNIPKP